MASLGMRLSYRSVAVACVVTVALVVFAGAAIVLVAEEAGANHATCSVNARTPRKITHGEFDYIWYKSSVNCADGTTARHYSWLQRHRWWGWQEVFEAEKALNDDGDSSLTREVHCPGSFISEGTWTFRTHGMVNTYHPGTSRPWRSKSDLSGTNRRTCRD